MSTNGNSRLPTGLLHRKIKELIAAGEGDQEIAGKVNITYQAVAQMRKAIEVQEATGIKMRNATCYLRVWEAPRDEWPRLAEAATRHRWSSKQIRECARAMGDDRCGSVVARLLAQPVDRSRGQALEWALVDLINAAERVRTAPRDSVVDEDVNRLLAEAEDVIRRARLPWWHLEALFRPPRRSS